MSIEKKTLLKRLVLFEVILFLNMTVDPVFFYYVLHQPEQDEIFGTHLVCTLLYLTAMAIIGVDAYLRVRKKDEW